MTTGIQNIIAPFAFGPKSELGTIVEITDADSPYAVLETDKTIFADATAGAVEVDLPASPAIGRIVAIRNVGDGTNLVAVDGNGSNIEAAVTDILGRGVGARYQFTGIEWFAIAEVLAGSLRGYIDGLATSNDAGDTEHDIRIEVGAFADSLDSNAEILVLVAALIKRIDAAWAEGSGNGGMATGSVAADDEYNLILIRENATGDIDLIFDVSATGANAPSGWVAVRRIGSVFTDGSSNIHGYAQDGNLFRFDDPIEDVSDTGGTLGVFSSASLTVPSSGLIKAHVYVVGNATINTDPGNIGINLRTNGRADAGTNEFFFGGRLAASSGVTVGVRGQGIVIADDGLIEYTLAGNLSTWVLARVRTYAYEDRRGRDE